MKVQSVILGCCKSRPVVEIEMPQASGKECGYGLPCNSLYKEEVGPNILVAPFMLSSYVLLEQGSGTPGH